MPDGAHTIPASGEVIREERLRLMAVCIADGGCSVCEALTAAWSALRDPDLSPEELAYLAGALAGIASNLLAEAHRRIR